MTMAKTEIRYCKRCWKDTRHDIFKDGPVRGQKVDSVERTFFAIITLGFTELITDKWRQCQVCDRKERV